MNNTASSVKKEPQQPTKPSAIRAMAARLSVEEGILLKTLKDTVFKNASNEELVALVTVANEYDLNPFLKEIYAFPAKGGGITPIVSVDGWNKMLIRQPSFDGIEFEFQDGEDGRPHSCTATVYVKNRSRPVKLTEFFDECFRATDPWKNMPRRMLRNRTLCQAARIAFGFSGVYHEDEGATVTVESSVLPATPPPKVIPLATAGEPSHQKQLESWCLAEGFTFDQFRNFAATEQNLQDADSFTSFDELPADLCKRMMKAQAGLKAALMAIKEGK